MAFWIIQAFNGVSFAMLLFLLSAGLSIIFGVMKVINLAHGSFYLLGGYVALSVVSATGSFLLAIITAVLAGVCAALVMQIVFLRRFYENELAQVLLTFGFLFIIADLCLVIWGGNPQVLPKPALFARSYRVGEIVIPSYRLFVTGVGLFFALFLWLLFAKTRWGAMTRAAVDDAEMSRGLGINVPGLCTVVFPRAFSRREARNHRPQWRGKDNAV
ncbi:MAG: branched-chain amino acid ABC transporter permease [Candidatus Binatia bacterium]